MILRRLLGMRFDGRDIEDLRVSAWCDGLWWYGRCDGGGRMEIQAAVVRALVRSGS